MGLGYMSEAEICGVPVLATGSSISPSYENIVSNGVRGAGYLYAGPSVFAWDYAKWEGSLEWDLGRSDRSFGEVGRWATTDRDTFQSIHATPGKCYDVLITGKNSSFSGNTSSNSLVSLSAGALAIGESGSISGTGGITCGYPPGAGNTTWCGNDGLLAYWMTRASLANMSGCATDWNFQINNSLVPIFCCTGETGEYSNPTTILLGPTTATASATFWDGSLDSLDFWGRDQVLTIMVGNLGTVTVRGRVQSTEASIQTGESIVGAGVTIEGIACEQPCVVISAS